MQSLKKKIYFVTGNPKKLKEFKAIVGDSYKNIEFQIKDIDLPEIQGQPEQVALTKCRLAAQKIKKAQCDSPVIVQDTSLCYNSLKGLPGPYITYIADSNLSKFFLSKLGTDGLYRILHGFQDKSAYAQCIFAYAADSKSEIQLFPGQTMGKIVEPRGPDKFGWDPVFQPDGFQQTFAQMDAQVKNSISHRYRALEKLKDFFQKEF